MDRERREEYLQKEQERNRSKLERGLQKKVKDMTAKEHRAVRKYWKRHQQKSRKNKKDMKDILNFTPPSSPEIPKEPSRQKKQRSKKKSKDMAKCYRDNVKLQKDLKRHQLIADKYRKRLQRQYEELKANENMTYSPRKKARQLLRNASQKTVRKVLAFQGAIIEAMKKKYKSIQMKGFKKEIGEILHSSILRKYKMKTAAMSHLGINLRNERVKQRKSLSRSMYSHIRDFFERDDVSRLSAGI